MSELTDPQLRLAVTLATMPGDERVHRDISELGMRGAHNKWRAGDGPKVFCQKWKRAIQIGRAHV